MTMNVPPPTRPAWAEQVLAEAIAYANRLASDFKMSIDVALRHAPNPKDPAHRGAVLNEFFNVLPDVTARLICDFGSPSDEIEKIFIDIVRARFAAQRNAAELKAKSKPHIISSTGAPLS